MNAPVLVAPAAARVRPAKSRVFGRVMDVATTEVETGRGSADYVERLAHVPIVSGQLRRSEPLVADLPLLFAIVRETTKGLTGEEGYGAVGHHPDRLGDVGLEFGICLFPQSSTLLGAVLTLFNQRDTVAFTAVFGHDSAGLLTAASASDEADRMAPIAGEAMSSPVWKNRFVAAGREPSCASAQNEVAIELLLRPMSRLLAPLGCVSGRSLAIALDVVIAHGLGGGAHRIAVAANPFRDVAQLQCALGMLGFNTLADLQRTTTSLSADGVLDVSTLLTLCVALRNDGRSLMPGAAEFSARVVDASVGRARDRRTGLLRSAALSDREIVEA